MRPVDFTEEEKRKVIEQVREILDDGVGVESESYAEADYYHDTSVLCGKFIDVRISAYIPVKNPDVSKLRRR